MLTAWRWAATLGGIAIICGSVVLVGGALAGGLPPWAGMLGAAVFGWVVGRVYP